VFVLAVGLDLSVPPDLMWMQCTRVDRCTANAYVSVTSRGGSKAKYMVGSSPVWPLENPAIGTVRGTVFWTGTVASQHTASCNKPVGIQQQHVQ